MKGIVFDRDELITKVYPMDAVSEVFEDMEAGRLASGVPMF